MRSISLSKGIVILVLVLFLFLTMVPLLLMFFHSFKDHLDIILHFWAIPEQPKWENYTTAWRSVGSSIGNSIYVCVFTIVGAVLISSLSGFAFARQKFPGKSLFFYMLIGVLMIPSVLTLVPLYAVITNFGLTYSFWGLILPYISGTQLLGVLLFRTFFSSLPEELFEAARIDGAGEYLIYARIAIPLSYPILATVAIVTFIAVYSDFLWPMIVLDSSQRTFTLAAVNLTSNGRTDLGLSFAAYVIGSVPMALVIILGMKYYVQGMVSGAVKS